MQILRRGTPLSEKTYVYTCGTCNSEKTYVHTCVTCDTEFRFVESESQMSGDVGYVVIQCPVCQSRCLVSTTTAPRMSQAELARAYCDK